MERWGGTLVGALLICIPLVLAAALFAGFASAGHAAHLCPVPDQPHRGPRPRRLLRQFRHPQLRTRRLHRYRRLCRGDPHAAARHQGHRPAPTCRTCLQRSNGDCRRPSSRRSSSRRWSARSSACRSCAWAAPRQSSRPSAFCSSSTASSSAPSDFTRGANAFLGVPRMTGIWTALAIAVPAVFVARWFRDSRFGGQLRASREDETAARSIGIDVVRRRLLAWTISAAICAASGALLAHFLGAFSPSKFYFDDTLALLTMLIVGGMTTVSGAFFGAVAVTLTVEILRRAESGIDILGWQTPELFGLTQAGLCVLILLVMYRRPSGIFARLELGEAAIRRWFGRGAAPASERADGGHAAGGRATRRRRGQELRRPPRPRRRRSQPASGRDRRADRSERLGQDHAAQRHLRSFRRRAKGAS